MSQVLLSWTPLTEFDLRSPIVVWALSVWEFLDYDPCLSLLSQNLKIKVYYVL